MDKHPALLELAHRRQAARWPPYKYIGDYQGGAYECDFVSPYTKSAGNVDATVMVLLQDWSSDAGLSGELDPEARDLGYLNITDEEMRRALNGVWERRRQLRLETTSNEEPVEGRAVGQ